MRLKTFRIFLAGMILAGCGEAAGPTVTPEPTPPTPPVTPAPVAASVRILVDTTFADIQANGHRIVYVDIGLPRTLKVLAADAAGSEIKSPALTWAFSDGTVATVAADGTVNGTKAGTTVLAVASGTVTDTVTVQVSTPMTGSFSTSSTDVNAEVPLLPPLGYVPLIGSGSFTGGSAPFQWTYSIDGAPDSATFKAFNGGELVIPGLPVGHHVVTVKIKDKAGASFSAQQPFLIQSPSRAYTVQFLGTLGGDDSHARAISQNGIVVGDANTASGEQHAVMWQNGSISDLTPDLPNSYAIGVNSLGQAVGGISDCSSAGNRGFLVANGQRTMFADCAMNINDRGTILFAARGKTVAVLYQGAITTFNTDSISNQVRFGLVGSGARFLGPLNSTDGMLVMANDGCQGGACQGAAVLVRPPGSAPSMSTVETHPAVDVNDAGQAAVNSWTGSVSLLFDGAVGINTLRFSGSSPKNTCKGFLVALNNRGLALGRLPAFGCTQQSPFIWDWNAGHVYRVVLPDNTWVIDGVTKINDAGQIIGHAVNSKTGQKGAVLLQPAP